MVDKPQAAGATASRQPQGQTNPRAGAPVVGQSVPATAGATASGQLHGQTAPGAAPPVVGQPQAAGAGGGGRGQGRTHPGAGAPATRQPQATGTVAPRQPQGQTAPSGGATGANIHQDPISRLSRECQRRGLELHWLPWNPKGNGHPTWMVDIGVGQLVFKGEMVCSTKKEAHAATALKVLAFLEATSEEVLALIRSSRGDRTSRGPPSAPRMQSQGRGAVAGNGNAQSAAQGRIAQRETVQITSGPSPRLPQLTTQRHQHTERHGCSQSPEAVTAALGEQLGSVLGVSPPREARGNPAATHAFLQGLAMGAGLLLKTSSDRRRSRSPDGGNLDSGRRGRFPSRSPDRSYQHQSTHRRSPDHYFPAGRDTRQGQSGIGELQSERAQHDAERMRRHRDRTPLRHAFGLGNQPGPGVNRRGPGSGRR